jgi:hypothetical protein
MKLSYFSEAKKELIRFGGEEITPKPEKDEVVVFKSFFKAGLRFPLNGMIADVLKKFGIYLHQLTPNAIVRLSVYIWALRSQGVEPFAEGFYRVHELHYQTKAREDGLHENFGCYNFAYRKNTKFPVISYRTKWPAGWKTEWFYVKVDEEKEKLVQSPLELIFGETRPQCNMTPKSPSQIALGEFRVIAEHIGTRDLVQELVKDDEEKLKKRKLRHEPKTDASKKRKVAAPKQKATDIEEETAATPSATDMEEILKVMTESLPTKLSPLGLHLTKLFQKEKEPSITKKAAGPKKRRIVTVTEVIEGTPPTTSASKAPAVESATATEAALTEAATAEAATAEDVHLESTLYNIDKILLNMATEEAAAAAEEAMATVPEKEKEIAEDASEEEIFNFQNLVGQELTKAEKEELKEYAISCGYQPGALLFGGVDDEKLGYVRDQTGAKVIGTLSKSIGFPKLETDISRYRRQHLVGSLFYSNFKVKTFLRIFIVFNNEGVF